MSFGVSRVGEWNKARRLTGPTAPVRIKAAIGTALQQEAKFFRDEIKLTLRKSGANVGMPFKAISPGTRFKRRFLLRRGRRPLISAGLLLKAVAVKRLSPLSAFVGIGQETRRPGGKSLVRAAIVQEFGDTLAVPATATMIRFLHLLYATRGDMPMRRRKGETKGVIKTIFIPIESRPFIRATYDFLYSNPLSARARYMARVATLLAGDYGGLRGRRGRGRRGGGVGSIAKSTTLGSSSLPKGGKGRLNSLSRLKLTDIAKARIR